ncbi:polysaccharide deacetylase family protein [Streptosporangium sp. DT93]|uniref:polysaccharide deacetylase family protein n=1 Tax=Streptosporangium sp. DT93 TaxID=3393428 RepID=UPI003CFA4690
MPKKRFIGGIAWVVAMLAGCGAATASPATRAPLPSEPTMINYVDPSVVHGLTIRTLSTGERGGRRMHASYPAVAGAPRLTDRLRDTVEDELHRFTWRKTPGDTAVAPEFNVDWLLAAASEEVLGVRLRVGRSMDAGWRESRTTLWYDRTDRRVLDSAGLIRDDAAMTTLVRLVGQEMTRRGTPVRLGSLRLDPLRLDPAMFDSLVFNPRGDLVVEFDDGQVGSRATGRVAVAVPSAVSEPLLSPTGLRARRAVVSSARPSGTSEQDMLDASTDKPPARSSRAGEVDCARARCVALTYDDGPGPGTGRLLDVLGRYGARATFFPLGSGASARPDLLRRMRDEGHLVANHTWSHRDLTMLTTLMVTSQLDRAQHAIAQAIGQAPTLMRPPYGGLDGRVADVAGGLGMSVVRWNVNADDREDPAPRAIAERVVARTGPGSIVLMHDVHDATVDAAPEILRRLTEAGYTFVTVPELYGRRAMRPGWIYDSGAAATSPERLSASYPGAMSP